MNQIAPERGLRVSELAAAVGVTPDTIRYYERVALLPAPARTRAGYRIYGHTAIDRLRFIQGAQRLGLRLAEILDLLAIRDTGACPCEPAAPLLRQRVVDLDAKIRELSALRSQIGAMLDALPGTECLDPAPGTWRPRPDERG
jgi:DNA-binding transcriptional MerR regulator